MNKIYVLNAVSINMNGNAPTALIQMPVSTDEAREMLSLSFKEVKSFIGHPDTARVISDVLDMEIPTNRGNFNWAMADPRDRILVAQYMGPRLPEGATKLPEGATIAFWEILPFQGEDLRRLMLRYLP